MKNQHALTVLTLVNLGFVIFLLLHQIGPVEASSPASVVRGSGLEIVDAQGKVRASIQIVPTGRTHGRRLRCEGWQDIPGNRALSVDSSGRAAIREDFDRGARLRTYSRWRD